MVSPQEMLTGRAHRRHPGAALFAPTGNTKDPPEGQQRADFDDIIYITVQLLQQNEDVLQYYQRKFRYVLVI